MTPQDSIVESTPSHIGAFRLVTGEDVITEFVYHKDCYYTWTHPLKLIFRRQTGGEVGIMLIPWLPEEILLLENKMQCNIALRDVMTILPIRDSMKVFYQEVREIMESRIKKNNDLLDSHIYDMTAIYMTEGSKNFQQRLLEEYEEQFNNMDDMHEGIIFN